MFSSISCFFQCLWEVSNMGAFFFFKLNIQARILFFVCFETTCPVFTWKIWYIPLPIYWKEIFRMWARKSARVPHPQWERFSGLVEIDGPAKYARQLVIIYYDVYMMVLGTGIRLCRNYFHRRFSIHQERGDSPPPPPSWQRNCLHIYTSGSGWDF